jgi:hypothetical protein
VLLWVPGFAGFDGKEKTFIHHAAGPQPRAASGLRRWSHGCAHHARRGAPRIPVAKDRLRAKKSLGLTCRIVPIQAENLPV